MFSIVKKQVEYKLYTNLYNLTILTIIQYMGLLLTFKAQGAGSYYNWNIEAEIEFFSGSNLEMFTIFWLIGVAYIITSQKKLNADFEFITNRASSYISNFIILFLMALVGSNFSKMVFIMFKFLRSWLYQDKTLIIELYQNGFSEVLMSIITTTIYLFLIALIIYFFNIVNSFNKNINFVILPIILGVFVLESSNIINFHILKNILSFLTKEHNFIIFIIKAILVCCLLFLVEFNLINRLEVRK